MLMCVLSMQAKEPLLLQLVQPVVVQPHGMQSLQHVILLERRLGTKVEAVNNMCHIHPCVVKGVVLISGCKVQGTGNLLDQHKACRAVQDRLELAVMHGAYSGTSGSCT